MGKLTIRQRIIASFVLVLTVVSLGRIVTLVQLAAVGTQMDRLQAVSLPGLTVANELRKDAEADLLLVSSRLSAATPRVVSEESGRRVKAAADMDRLERLYKAAHDGTDGAAYDAYVAARSAYDREADRVIELSSNARNREAARMQFTARVRPAFTSLSQTLEAMVAINQSEARAAAARTAATLAAARTLSFLSFALTALTTILCGYFLTIDICGTLRRLASTADRMAIGDLTIAPATLSRTDEIGSLLVAFDRIATNQRAMAHVAEEIAAGNLSVGITPLSNVDVMGNALDDMTKKLSTLVSDIARSGVRVASSVNQLAATAKQQKATANGTVATASEIATTSNEIYSTSRELVKTMSEVATVAEETSVLAGNGQRDLMHMSDTMDTVIQAGGSITEKLASLNEKAASIYQVVTTITKIADQTNLLSLNAAIEAEKAGDYGRGFSVVATEIRRLADQTAVATYDIEQTVKEILAAISASVKGMDDFSETVRRGTREVAQIGSKFGQIIEQVQALAPRVESVSEGMQAQASGAEEITDAIRHLTEAARQTAESLEISSQAVDELNLVSSGLHTGVSTFRLAA